MNKFTVGVLGSVLALVGCPSNDNQAEPFCSVFGAGATYTFTCNGGCTLGSAGQASDHDLQTTATVVPVNGQTTYTAVLTATSANDIPAGADVGVFVTQPGAATRQSMTNSFRTLRDGVEQETSNADNGVVSPSDTGTPADGFIGMSTTQAFDQVEFTTTVTWTAGQSPVYYVYEVCADGGNL